MGFIVARFMVLHALARQAHAEPAFNRTGSVFAVMQLNNKLDYSAFERHDEEKFHAMAVSLTGVIETWITLRQHWGGGN